MLDCKRGEQGGFAGVYSEQIEFDMSQGGLSVESLAKQFTFSIKKFLLRSKIIVLICRASDKQIEVGIYLYIVIDT